MQPVTILFVVCCLGIAFACLGNSTDHKHECNDGEVCMDGRCLNPCGSGWRMVVDDPPEACHDRDHCPRVYCRSECQSGNQQQCGQCFQNVQCRASLCCKNGNLALNISY